MVETHSAGTVYRPRSYRQIQRKTGTLELGYFKNPKTINKGMRQ